MQSFIDQEYFTHFFSSIFNTVRFSEKEKLMEEIFDFFAHKTDIFVDSDFAEILSSLDKSIQQPVSTLFFTQLTTGRNGNKIYTGQQNKFRELRRVDIYSKLKIPFASFWLGKDYNFPVTKYSEKNPYIFISKDNDVKEWSKISRKHTFWIGKTENINKEEVLTSWEMLKPFAHQYKDIIISDRYCLKDETGIRKNILPVISNLSLSPELISNVIFFAKPGMLFNNSLADTHELISEQLLQYNIKANVTIYVSHKTPHDRYIITNNYFIKSGDSFDYFNAGGKLKTKGTHLSINPVFDANKTELNELLRTLKEIRIKSSEDMYYGSKSKCILDLI